MHLTRTDAIIAAIIAELNLRRTYLDALEAERKFMLVLQPRSSDADAWMARTIVPKRSRTSVWRAPAKEKLTTTITNE